jgi:hypothetical protein
VSAETSGDTRPAQLIKVVDGTFQVHYFRTEKKLYKLTNQTDREKVVYIEHPIRKGWGISSDSATPDIVTDKFYRFRVTLKPFEKSELTVVERQGLMDSYALLGLTRDQLQLFVTRKYIDEPTRARLEKLIAIRAQIGEVGSKLEAADSEVERIEADQKRIRENIESLTKTAEAKTLIERYIAKANEQESRLEQIEKDRKTFEAEKERLERELSLEIKNFEIK